MAAGDGVTIQDCGPSCWPAPFGMVLTVLIAVSMAVCIVITTFGNLLVIVSFAVDRQIRQPTNYFICSLAVTDVLIGTVSMPLYTVSSSSKNPPHLFAKFWIFILSLSLFKFCNVLLMHIIDYDSALGNNIYDVYDKFCF